MATLCSGLRSGKCGAALVVALALSAAAPLAQADLLYGTTAIGASPRTSDYGSTSQFGWRSFENFTVAGGGSVQRITWTGLWFGGLQPDPAPAPDVLSWDIAFHASTGTAPGAQLTLQNYLAAQVTATPLGTGVLSAGGLYNVSYYQYSIDLATPVDVLGGTEYWLSIMAHSDEFSPAFAWSGAVGGDDASYQQLLGAGGAVTDEFARARDRHVLLEGVSFAVPEPGSVLLVALALGALGAARRSVRGRKA